ncbi:MAG: phenylacetate-CoA oxygenase subunit PaaJ [Ardenticatenales bacterium]|nr:phenylacetate-CoA oxygenase subunit PaaJ [Ardenticatenales bacterium]
MVSEQQVWEALEGVADPEIPVVSVVDLGIVQEIEVSERGVRVAITPTFAGCPALYLMKEEIRQAVEALGVACEDVTVEVKLSPPWSSERISEKGRRSLAEIGLAPPERVPAQGGLIALDTITLADGIACPFCNSHETHLESAFGPTMCRSLYYCNSCKQPFEKFKAL